ncbi:MAG: hypothetical protein V4754_10815 [Pseudomonadota bacterium]
MGLSLVYPPVHSIVRIEVTMLAWLERLFCARRAGGAADRQGVADGGDGPADAVADLSASPSACAAPRQDNGRAANSFDQKDNINNHYHGWLFDNRQDETDLHINAQEQLVLDALDALLASQQSGADLVRRMPGLLPQVLAESDAVAPFDAFLAGLVQNTGLIVALRVMDRIGVNHQLGSVLFCAGLQDKSLLLARDIGQEWGFPEAVTMAIGDQLGNAKRRQLSPLGRLLTLGDYLSKVKMLVEHGRLRENASDLFKGVPADALQYYQRMNAFEDALPTMHPSPPL